MRALLYAQAAALSHGEESGSTWAPDGLPVALPSQCGGLRMDAGGLPRAQLLFPRLLLGLSPHGRISSDIDSTRLSRPVGKAARSLKRGGTSKREPPTHPSLSFLRLLIPSRPGSLSAVESRRPLLHSDSPCRTRTPSRAFAATVHASHSRIRLGCTRPMSRTMQILPTWPRCHRVWD